MNKLNASFYDIYKSYDDNYKKLPLKLRKYRKVNTKNNKKFTFLGFPINIPFGIPAGPLLNSKYIKAAFDLGFDVSTYKTVRSIEFPCHPHPNIVYVKSPKNLYPDKTKRLTQDDSKKNLYPLAITNSFGVPSKKPSVWQNDVKKALKYQKNGQLLILSLMGTVKENQSQNDFINDYVKTALKAKKTGAKAIEINLSCPNIGNEGLVCYNLDLTEKICKKVKEVLKKTPLIIKVGFYKNPKDIKKLAEIANKYVDAIAAINTLQSEVVNKNGDQALPGKNRLRSGVCGSCIKWAGVDMVKKLADIRKKNNYKYEIIGVGGVMNVKDFRDYLNAGADLVQSATGAMWNTQLAEEISNSLLN